jgi:hypothetical protein
MTPTALKAVQPETVANLSELRPERAKASPDNQVQDLLIRSYLAGLIFVPSKDDLNFLRSPSGVVTGELSLELSVAEFETGETEVQLTTSIALLRPASNTSLAITGTYAGLFDLSTVAVERKQSLIEQEIAAYLLPFSQKIVYGVLANAGLHLSRLTGTEPGSTCFTVVSL